MMVDPLLEDDAADRPEPGGERLLVAGGDVERIGKQRAPPLHVEKPGRPTEVEADLLRIEEVIEGDVVAAKAKVPEGPGKCFRLHEQIGENHDQRPLADGLGDLVEHLRETRGSLRAGLLEGIEDEA